MLTDTKLANYVVALYAAVLAVQTIGCSAGSDEPQVAKPPRPVSTMILRRSSPSFQRHTTASVSAWKVEQIGFEQVGRVVSVIEPNEMVKAQTTLLAKLDDERLKIAVEAAEADADVAQRRLEANLVAINKRLPAVIETSEAEQDLAKSELARAERLASSNSLSQSEIDAARTRASTARLRVESSRADLAQSIAEQSALQAQSDQAQQRLKEANRNLKNTELFSSFPGQVAATHAVPGTYVKEGDPIVTVQMIDPMLVEFEVSADDSRRYQRGDTLNVSTTNRNGDQRRLSGMVYTVDAVADVSTKTFTVTLHVRNQAESDETSQEIELLQSGVPVARTRLIYPLNLGPIVTGDERLLVEQSAVHRIGNRDFVWKITNRAWDKPSYSSERVLNVKRVPVSVTGETIQFLGTWNFVPIKFEDPTGIDLQRDMITGPLYFDPTNPSSVEDLEDWQGNQVVMDRTRWALRAGDTVRVTMIPKNPVDGFYVPMKAVRQENDQTFIHIVTGKTPDSVARRVRVSVADEKVMTNESILFRIVPDDSADLHDSADPVRFQEGDSIVIGGTHYLNDGDRVRIVALPESGR